MKSKLLLSHKSKWLGVVLFVPAFILGFSLLIFDYELAFLNVKLFTSSSNNLTDEIALTFTVIGLMLIAFSREKQEDEFIQKIRLESLQWAVLVSYLLLLLCTWFIYYSDFIIAMVANLLTVLIIFNLRFHWILMRTSRKNEIA